jgi:hypothetical protein
MNVRGGMYSSNINGLYTSAVDDMRVYGAKIKDCEYGVRGITDTTAVSELRSNVFDGNTVHVQAERPFVGLGYNTYLNDAANATNIAGAYGLTFNLAATATPDIKGRTQGRVGAGTDITTFLNPPLFQSFQILATGTRTINESGNIRLNGVGTSVALASGDALTLFYDGATIYEVGRKIL